jgi:RND family efflux transporter MFP subunit
MRTLATLILLAATVGCRGRPAEEIDTTAAVPVRTLTATPHAVQSVIAVTGTVSPAPGAEQTVSPPASARIAEMPKAEGDRVREGDLLVRFEIPSLASDVAAKGAELAQARARLENAQAASARLTTLVEHGVAAQKELEDARRELAEARAAVTQAESGVQGADVLASRMVVRARFAGVIAARSHNPGDLVEPSDTVLRVIDPERLQILGSVPVSAVERIDAGQPARVIDPAGGPGEAAQVLTRAAAVQAGGATANVRLAFDHPTRLPAGAPVQLEITITQHPNALSVPPDAVVHEDDAEYVFVAGSDNKAHRRKVTLGLTTPREIEVTSGLKAGDLVIVEGQQALPDGAAISVSK